MSVSVDDMCEIVMGGERMEVVKEFKYLRTVLSKHGEMEGEVRERAVRGRSVIGSVASVMKGMNVSLEVRRGLRNSIHLPTLMYGLETWTWNSAQQSRVCAMGMSYLRGACGVTRQDGESNESVYERWGMGSQANGVECGVVKWVKRYTLRWFGHIERMGSEEFVKKVYMSELVGPSSRGRPPGRWRDRVKEYMCEGELLPEGEGWVNQRGSVWTGRGGDFSAVAVPVGGHSRRE